MSLEFIYRFTLERVGLPLSAFCLCCKSTICNTDWQTGEHTIFKMWNSSFKRLLMPLQGKNVIIQKTFFLHPHGLQSVYIVKICHTSERSSIHLSDLIQGCAAHKPHPMRTNPLIQVHQSWTSWSSISYVQALPLTREQHVLLCTGSFSINRLCTWVRMHLYFRMRGGVTLEDGERPRAACDCSALGFQ